MSRSVTSLALLLLVGCPEKTDPAPVDDDTGTQDDSGDDTGVDTVDTGETGDTEETGDTQETGETGETGDTGDTGAPAAQRTGYWGRDTLALLLADAADAGKGRIAMYDPVTGTLAETPDVRVGADARLECVGDAVWVLDDQVDASLPDRALRIDPEAGVVTSRLNFTDGFAAHDVAWVNGHTWFSSSTSASIQTYADDGTVVSTIDLSSLVDSADPDGSPDVLGMRVAGRSVLLVARRNDSTTNVQFGAQLVQLDVDGTITGTVDLQRDNVSGKIVADGATAFVHYASTNDADIDGGVEAVRLNDLYSQGLKIDDLPAGRVQQLSWMEFGSDLWTLYEIGGADPTVAQFDLESGTVVSSWAYAGTATALVRLQSALWFAEADGLHRYLIADGSTDAPYDPGDTILAVAACQEGEDESASAEPEPDTAAPSR